MFAPGDRVRVVLPKPCGCENYMGDEFVVSKSVLRHRMSSTCGTCEEPYDMPDGTHLVLGYDSTGRWRKINSYRLTHVNDRRVLLCP